MTLEDQKLEIRSELLSITERRIMELDIDSLRSIYLYLYDAYTGTLCVNDLSLYLEIARSLDRMHDNRHAQQAE